MKVFEYKISSSVGLMLEDFLNDMGAEGWELILILQPDRYYFKRQRTDDD